MQAALRWRALAALPRSGAQQQALCSRPCAAAAPARRQSRPRTRGRRCARPPPQHSPASRPCKRQERRHLAGRHCAAQAPEPRPRQAMAPAPAPQSERAPVRHGRAARPQVLQNAQQLSRDARHLCLVRPPAACKHVCQRPPLGQLLREGAGGQGGGSARERNGSAQRSSASCTSSRRPRTQASLGHHQRTNHDQHTCTRKKPRSCSVSCSKYSRYCRHRSGGRGGHRGDGAGRAASVEHLHRDAAHTLHRAAASPAWCAARPPWGFRGGPGF